MSRIVANNLSKDFTGYIDRIDRYLPGRYLVHVGISDHPSVRVCYLIDLAKFQRSHASTQVPCTLGRGRALRASRSAVRIVALVWRAVQDAQLIPAIRDELFRLRARRQDVGDVDAISVQDRSHGNAVLTGSARRLDFNYFGSEPRSSSGCAAYLTTAGLRRSVRSSVAVTEPGGR